MRYHNVLCAGIVGVLGASSFFCAGAIAATTQKRSQAKSAGAGADLQIPAGVAHVATDRLAMVRIPLKLSALPDITPWHEFTVHAGDSLSKVFARADLGASQWMAVLDLKGKTSVLKHLQPGDVLKIRKTPDGRLEKLRYRLGKLETLLISRDKQGLHASVTQQPTTTRRILATGTVRHSLSNSLARAGVPTTVANKLAQIYRYRDNLSRHMHPGDTFSVIYNAVYSRGQRVANGPVIAASITTNGHNLKAFRVLDKSGDPGYYDASGHSYRPSISRHPVNYTRISSPFNLHRMNPVLHIVRPHDGVDMAAPMGTPIHAAADGTVKFVGRQHGYGRIVELRHFEGYTTRYAHMHRFARGLHDGERVHQGQVIGYVGESGEATGPHLHFEIRKNGVPHNPLTMKLPVGKPLPHSELATFTARIRPLIARLDQLPNTLVASSASPAVGSQTPSCTGAVALKTGFPLSPAAIAHRHGITSIFCAPHRAPTNI